MTKERLIELRSLGLDVAWLDVRELHEVLALAEQTLTAHEKAAARLARHRAQRRKAAQKGRKRKDRPIKLNMDAPPPKPQKDWRPILKEQAAKIDKALTRVLTADQLIDASTCTSDSPPKAQTRPKNIAPLHPDIARHLTPQFKVKKTPAPR